LLNLSDPGFAPDFCDTVIATLNAVLPQAKELYEDNPS